MSHLSDRQYGLLSHRQLLVKLKNSSTITKRLSLDYTLNIHRGCVNTIWWNEYGTTILSGSDDHNLIVTDPFTRKILVQVHSGHRENIFSAKFLPETNDRRVVSCSGDGVVFHTDFDLPDSTRSAEGCFRCHGATTAYEVRVIPYTPNLFLSCADDCTVRLYDLRTKSHCLKYQCTDDILIKSSWGITSMDINSMNSNEIVCACADSSIRLYDHRKLSTQISSTTALSRQYELSMNGLVSLFSLSGRQDHHRSRITSVVFNQHGTEILASYSSESIFLLDPKQTMSQEQMKERLTEHRNKKQSKSNIKEKYSTPIGSQKDETKTSNIQRLRVRGDWSDTGPDARPSNEQEPVEPITNPAQTSSEQPSSATSGRELQNILMRRMSDILTQLVTRTTSEPEHIDEETDPIATLNHTETTNDNITPSSSTIERTMRESSPSSIPTENATVTNTNHDNEDDNQSNRFGIFDLIFGNSPRLHNEADEDDDDEVDVDNNNDEDDDTIIDDDDDNSDLRITSATAADNVYSFGHTPRTHISTKWERMRKRREDQRAKEESLMKNIPSLGLLNSYEGHRNERTMIKEANFWSDSYVMSGSDCGHIFIWNKFNGNIVRIIPADEHVVNCIQPHPLNYPILASSGIDYNIKIFSPSAETPIDDSDRIELAVQRNRAMSEETSSTVTLPATFMLRMLTSIYRLRHREGFSSADDD